MKYQWFGDTCLIRVDRGEEIMKTLNEICLKENILLASISGLGAVDHVEIGVFSVTEHSYHKNILDGEKEITSLVGNVTELDGLPHLHLHITLGGQDGRAYAGHLDVARISVTSEIFLHKLDGRVTRCMDENTGLNLWKL